MASPKKKAKKTDKPTPQEDPKLKELIQQAMRQVGPGNFKLNPNIYTEEFFRKWLPIERSKQPSNYDYIPNLEHLKTLAIWDQWEMYGVLFGISGEGFFKMTATGRLGRPWAFSERIICVRKQTEKYELEPRYECDPKVKSWYLQSISAINKFEEILSRGYGTIPGIGWKGNAYFFIVSDFIPWLERFGFPQWLKKEGCRVPVGLANFLKNWEDPLLGEKKPVRENVGGAPSPKKDKAVERLIALFKTEPGKKLREDTPTNKLAYTDPVLNAILEGQRIFVTPSLILKMKNSNAFFKEIVGTIPRNFNERWLKDVFSQLDKI